METPTRPKQFIMTATGGVALLDDGKWYSVNGGEEEVVDIRYEIELDRSWSGTAAEREAVRQQLKRHPHTKGDGSWWEKDGQGIPLCRVCSICRTAKLSTYRPEILRPYSQADVDEPIEEDL